MSPAELLTLVSIAIVLYAYLGYPLMLGALAAIMPRPVRQGRPTGSLSLILPLHNEADVVAARVDNLRQRIPPGVEYEILLVNDGSVDATLDNAQALQDAHTRVIDQQPRQGKSAAINRAVSEAQGDFLVFTDAHARFEENTIEYLLRNFADPQVGAVTGDTGVDPTRGIGAGESLYWRYEAWLKRQESIIHSSCAVTGAIVAMRKSVFRPIPDGIINDDAWMNLDVMRRGLRFVQDPDARCIRAPSSTLAEDRKRRQRIAAGRYQLLLRPSLWPWRLPSMLYCYGSHKFLRLLLGIPMVMALLANIVAVVNGSGLLFITLLAMQFGFYTLAIAGVALEHKLPTRLGMLSKAARFLISVNVGDLGGFLRYLTGRNNTLWVKTGKAH